MFKSRSEGRKVIRQKDDPDVSVAVICSTPKKQNPRFNKLLTHSTDPRIRHELVIATTPIPKNTILSFGHRKPYRIPKNIYLPAAETSRNRQQISGDSPPRIPNLALGEQADPIQELLMKRPVLRRHLFKEREQSKGPAQFQFLQKVVLKRKSELEQHFETQRKKAIKDQEKAKLNYAQLRLKYLRTQLSPRPKPLNQDLPQSKIDRVHKSLKKKLRALSLTSKADFDNALSQVSGLVKAGRALLNKSLSLSHQNYPTLYSAARRVDFN